MNRLEARVRGGKLSIRRAGERVLTAWAEARLGDGRVLSSRDGKSGALGLTVTSLPWGAVEIVLRLSNTGPDAVRVEQLLPIVTDRIYGNSPGQLRIGEMGWQSWSRPHPPLPLRPSRAPNDLVREPISSHRLPGGQVSAWMALLDAGQGNPLLLGFTRAVDFTGAIEITHDRLQASCDIEGLELPPGETIAGEPLLIAQGPEPELLSGYADAAAGHMGARRWPRVPTGWCSWYHFYTNVTEDDLRRNLEALSRLRDRAPIELFQLDDGYQREVGDWLTLNDKFPSGMPALVRSIREHGFTPGIWLAPFLLSARSRTYAQHPDWVVRSEGGSPLSVVRNWGCDNYALDTTNPEALDWIEHVIHTICRDWGYDYLKIDFIYAAAVRGRRRRPEVTAVQAYRRGLERIRSAAGERFILGCGAPFLPSVGLVDGMRVGEDVAPFWRRENNQAGPAMNNALQSTLLHNWMHRRWWINDPDCVMVRAHDSQLTLEEVRAWAGVVALSGGMVLVSDDLARLEPERIELLGRLFPPLGQTSEALPPYVDGIPERLRLAIDRPWGGWWTIGLANWSEEERAATFDPAEWDLPAGSYHLVDLWDGAHYGPRVGTIVLRSLAPHEMHLLEAHPDTGRPQVVGSTGHLLGAAMDVAEERCDGHSLNVLLTDSARRGELLVYVPEGWETEHPLRDGLLRLPLEALQPRGLRVAFRALGGS
ncbi:MAG: alpha-galactosidase [Chloroflexota bacterium]|nr:alpha-galactosidase [Chloroflexota bacterium]